MPATTAFSDRDNLEEQKHATKILYISWAESCSRSDHTARELGGKSRMVYLSWMGSHPLTVGFKYLGQTFMTLWHLVCEKPDAIFVMSPPLFAAFPALLWKWLFGVPFVLDCHTGAFSNPRWRRFQRLQHFLGRQAATNLVTNEIHKKLVEENGGKATIVRDVPVVYQLADLYPLSTRFNVAAICSFNYDEPIIEMFKAAGRLSDVQFYFTGNPKHLRPEIAEQRPDNVVLTGFLSDQHYGSLVARADIVLTLTTQDHTMLRGAWEAVYQATPVIVSDWQILRESFSEGAIHVDNSSESIVEAVRFAEKNLATLRSQVERARSQRIERWRGVKESILKHLQ